MVNKPEAHIPHGFPGQRMIVLPRPVVRDALRAVDTADLLPTDVGYFPKAAGHEVGRGDGINQMIVIYCASGNGWVKLPGQEFKVQAGQVLVIGPRTPHVYGADETHSWTIYWLHVAGNKVARLHHLLTDAGTAPVFDCGLDSISLGLFDEVFETLRQSYGPDDLLLASLCAGRLLGRLVLARRKQEKTISAPRRIERAIDHMRAHMASRLSVPELARLANLSNSHFAAIFKQQTGYAVLDFFIRLKIRRAAHLLDTTSLPVNAIASELGFHDPLYFSRQFRRIQDLSPLKYRAIKKG